MGKSIEGLSQTERNIIDLQLNRIGMGYMKERGRKPHDPVSWVEEEHGFMHQFSLQRRADEYGYFRMREVLTLNDYLHMNADLVDVLMDGIRAGAERRLRDEKNKAPPDPPDPNAT